MADTGDDVWRAVKPEGLALAILATTLVVVVLTTIVIAMRIFIRLKTRNFGTDDWAMSIGYARSAPFSAAVGGWLIMGVRCSSSTWGNASWSSMGRTRASARGMTA